MAVDILLFFYLPIPKIRLQKMISSSNTKNLFKLKNLDEFRPSQTVVCGERCLFYESFVVLLIFLVFLLIFKIFL